MKIATQYILKHQITSIRNAGVLRITPSVPQAKAVFLLHGLESSKEWSLTTMYGLAREGFDTIAIDLFLHGDRPEAVNRDQLLSSDFIGSMRDIIYETAEDVPKIATELGVDFSQSGLLGISAGGFVGHVIAAQSVKPKAFVAAITSPDWTTINADATDQMPPPLKVYMKSISPVSHFRDYLPLALLQLHGLDDERVTPKGALELNDVLKPLYQSAGLSDRLMLKTYHDVAHYFSPEMLSDAVDWFKTHLAT